MFGVGANGVNEVIARERREWGSQQAGVYIYPFTARVRGGRHTG